MRRPVCFVLLVFFAVVSAKAQNDTVVFSAPGGFYEESFALQLFNVNTSNHIRYTTNGNRPDANSPLYSDSLYLDESLYSTSDIYTIINCPENEFYLPDSVQHCIVIRAAVFDENDSCVSAVKTNSYFIRSLGCDTHGLPAVSLCADSLDLFDYQRGIFVPGAWFDPLNPNWTGNYFQKGRNWERLMNIEFYELDNSGINQQAGLRTHGGNGRRFQQKCVKIYAREEYGKKRFKHKFFENIPLNRFKHLVLKPFEASWGFSGVNDHICNQIAAQLNVEALASRPVLLFLNGEYWGVYYIHERPDERYLEDHLDVDIDNVNLISGWNPIIDHGTSLYFNEFYRWMETADLSDDEAFAYAETKMDMNNFIDYQIFELFINNEDWPANNMRMWQIDDGSWRWIFFDGDGCLRGLNYFAFYNSTYVGSEWWPSSTQATLFFRRLLENDDFRTRFKERFVDLLHSTFSYSATGPFFDTIKATLEPEIPFQSARFGIPSSLETWNESMGTVLWFLMRRAEQVLGYLDDFVVHLNEYQYDAVRFYPNPSSGELHICCDNVEWPVDEICIYDMLGRKVFVQPKCSETVTSEITIHPHLTPGVYVLKIGNHAQRIVRY